MKRTAIRMCMALAALLLVCSTAIAADWTKKYPVVTLGVITAENEADKVIRYGPVQKYFEDRFGIDIKWRTATDYAGIIEGVKAGKIELAYFGPASYAKAYMVTNGKVEPLAGVLDKNGDLGYHSVVVVRKDSPYDDLNDLKDKKFAFADPNSTSGHQAPRYFLSEQGIDADKHFGSATFSGSHENSIMGLHNGTYDAVATFYRSETASNMTRMVEKGMIEPGWWKILWKSPKLPSSPFAMSTNLPKQMREDFREAILEMPEKSPEAWEAWVAGSDNTGFARVTHEDYEPIVRMIRANLKKRREG